MDSVAVQLRRQVRAIVQDHSHAAGLGDRLQGADGLGDRIVAHILQPDLQGGHIAAFQGLGEVAREPIQIGQDRRRNQIEAAGERHRFGLAARGRRVKGRTSRPEQSRGSAASIRPAPFACE